MSLKSQGQCVALNQTAGGRKSAAYIRVSTEDQHLTVQEDLIKAYKPDLIFSDKDSGTKISRAAYTRLVEAIKAGVISQVIVYRLDRLGRDPVELIHFFDLLDNNQVEFKSITEPWLSDWIKGPMQFLMWWLQIGMARFELLLLKDRQRRGIEASKAQGKHLGRPRKHEQVT